MESSTTKSTATEQSAANQPLESAGKKSVSAATEKRQQKNLQHTLKRLARKRPNQRCVFISYKWNPKMKAAADALYAALTAQGIFVLKDDQDMASGDTLEKFMDLIAHPKVDKAILLVDNDYLKARNCLYEVLKLSQAGGFKPGSNKTVVIAADTAIKTVKLDTYVKHWESQIQSYYAQNDDYNVWVAGGIVSALPGLINALVGPSAQLLEKHEKEDFAQVINAVKAALTESKQLAITQQSSTALAALNNKKPAERMVYLCYATGGSMDKVASEITEALTRSGCQVFTRKDAAPGSASQALVDHSKLDKVIFLMDPGFFKDLSSMHEAALLNKVGGIDTRSGKAIFIPADNAVYTAKIKPLEEHWQKERKSYFAQKAWHQVYQAGQAENSAGALLEAMRNKLGMKLDDYQKAAYKPLLKAIKDQGAGEVARVLMDSLRKEISHQRQNLHFYMPPSTIERLPREFKRLNALMDAYDAPESKEKNLPERLPVVRLPSASQAASKSQPQPAASAKQAVAIMDRFLESKDELLALLGGPGSGKSLTTWQVARALSQTLEKRFEDYEKNFESSAFQKSWVPLHIELKSHTSDSLKNILDKELREQGLGDQAIEKLQNPSSENSPEPRVLLILDGFDELRASKQKAGTTHRSGQVPGSEIQDLFEHVGAGQWTAGSVKVVVTCRNRHLPDESVESQIFGRGDRRRYMRRLLLPFSQDQIGEYILKRAQKDPYVTTLPAETYQAVLKVNPAVKGMVRSPFVLRLFVEALPSLLPKVSEAGKIEPKAIENITRFSIYEGFVKQWFSREVGRIGAEKRSAMMERGDTQDKLAQNFNHFSESLAMHMFHERTLTVTFNKGDKHERVPAYAVWSKLKKQIMAETEAQYRARLAAQGDSSVDTDSDDEEEGLTGAALKKHMEKTAKRRLKQFQITSPLRLAAGAYSFIHKSFYEYYIAHFLLQQDSAKKLGEALSKRNLQEEPEVIAFMAEMIRVRKGEDIVKRFKAALFEVIAASKPQGEEKNQPVRTDVIVPKAQAAANAATVLARSGVEMVGQDWAGVQLPGADLGLAVLGRTNFARANLRAVHWVGAFVLGCDFRGADLRGARFGELPKMDFEGYVRTLAVASQEMLARGRDWIAVGYGEMIDIIDRKTRQRLSQLKGHEGHGNVSSIAFSPDGKRLASGSGSPRDSRLRLWSLDGSGKLHGTPQVLKGHKGGVWSVAFSPDGKQVVSGSNDKTLRLWSLDGAGKLQGTPQVIEGYDGSVASVAFSPDGKAVVSGSEDKTLRLWRLDQAGRVQGAPQVIEGHDGSVASVAFSPDGKQVVSGSGDHTLRLWRLDQAGRVQGAPQVLKGHGSSVVSVAFSPDGKSVVSGSYDKSLRLWTLDRSGRLQGTPQVLKGHEREVYSVAFSPDGKSVVSGGFDKTLRIWSMDRLGKLQGAPQGLEGHEREVYSVAFSPDGKSMVSGSYDKTLRLWALDRSGRLQGTPQVLKGHEGLVKCVAFSPDGQAVVSGSWDHTLRLWRLDQSGRVQGAPQILKGHEDCVRSVAFSPDGKSVVSGDRDKTLYWSLDGSGKLRGVPQVLMKGGWVDSVAFSPDGKSVVIGGGKTLRLCSLNGAGKLQDDPQVLTGHGSSVIRSVAFSPDGKVVVSGGSDRTLCLWGLDQAGRVQGDPQVLKGRAVESVAFSPDGKAIVSGSEDKTLRLWVKGISGQWAEVDCVHWCSVVYSVAFERGKNQQGASEAKAGAQRFGSRIVVGDMAGLVSFWQLQGQGSAAKLVFEGLPVQKGMSEAWRGSWRAGPGVQVAGTIGDANTRALLAQYREMDEAKMGLVLKESKAAPVLVQVQAKPKPKAAGRVAASTQASLMGQFGLHAAKGGAVVAQQAEAKRQALGSVSASPKKTVMPLVLDVLKDLKLTGEKAGKLKIKLFKLIGEHTQVNALAGLDRKSRKALAAKLTKELGGYVEQLLLDESCDSEVGEILDEWCGHDRVSLSI